MAPPAANHEYDLAAGSEAVAEYVGKQIGKKLASLPPEERQAWAANWFRRHFGPSAIAAGLIRDDEQTTPPRRPGKVSAKPPRRKKAT